MESIMSLKDDLPVSAKSTIASAESRPQPFDRLTQRLELDIHLIRDRLDGARARAHGVAVLINADRALQVGAGRQLHVGALLRDLRC